jgi:hypothetical protein
VVFAFADNLKHRFALRGQFMIAGFLCALHGGFRLILNLGSVKSKPQTNTDVHGQAKSWLLALPSSLSMLSVFVCVRLWLIAGGLSRNPRSCLHS